VVPSGDDFGRPLLGCGLAGVREFAAYLGPPSYGVPKVTTTTTRIGGGPSGLLSSSPTSTG
jgi:hypothetical protein